MSTHRSDIIRKLISDQYPHADALRASAGTMAASGRLSELRAYEAELHALTEIELRSRYDDIARREASEAAVDREVSESQAKANQLQREETSNAAERALPFNRIGSEADYQYWAMSTYWTLDGATALSLGRDPDVATWETVQLHIGTSPFARAFARRRRIVERAMIANLLKASTVPVQFVEWAISTRLEIPTELIEAVKTSGSVVDWRHAFIQLRDEYLDHAQENGVFIDSFKMQMEELSVLVERQEQSEVKSEKALKARERSTLLKIILGMAVGKFRYDPADQRSKAIAPMMTSIQQGGQTVDSDTLRKWLRAAVAEVGIPDGAAVADD